MWHGMVLYWMVFTSLDSPLDSSGRTLGGWYVSTINIMCMCHLANLKVLQETITIQWRSFIGWWAFGWLTTIGFCWIFNFGGVSKALQPEIYGMMDYFYVFNLKTHLVVFFCPIICLIPDYIWSSFWWLLAPNES